MAVLERVLSDQWTEEMSTAWAGLWQVKAGARAALRRAGPLALGCLVFRDRRRASDSVGRRGSKRGAKPGG